MTVGSEILATTSPFAAVVGGHVGPSRRAVQAVRRAYAAIKGIDAGAWNDRREQELALQLQQLLLSAEHDAPNRQASFAK